MYNAIIEKKGIVTVMYSHYQLLNTVMQRKNKVFTLFSKVWDKFVIFKISGIQGIDLPFKGVFNRVP